MSFIRKEVANFLALKFTQNVFENIIPVAWPFWLVSPIPYLQLVNPAYRNIQIDKVKCKLHISDECSFSFQKELRHVSKIYSRTLKLLE